jgi:hypothetical protein
LIFLNRGGEKMSEILEAGVIKGPINEGGIIVPEGSVMINLPDNYIIAPFKEYREIGLRGLIEKYSTL